MEHQTRVRSVRQQQPNVHSALNGLLQRGKKLRIGNKVGVGQGDLGFRTVDGGEQGDVDLAVGFLGRTADGAHDLLALGARLGEVIPGGQRSALLLRPGFQEQLLEFRDDRSRHSQMGITPWQPVGSRLALAERATGVDAADIDAAHKGHFAIRDQQLAVIPLVDLPALAGEKWIDRIEFQDIDTACLQRLEERFRRAKGTHTVVDEVHLYPTALFADQEFGEVPPDLIIVQDVGFQIDVVLRVLDGGIHGLVGGRSIHQQLNLVADHQRAPHHRSLQGQMNCEDVGFVPVFSEASDHRLALLGAQGATSALELHRRRGSQRHVRHHDGHGAAPRQQRQTEGGCQ